jgi:SAM-dependent methyltransferase
MTGRAPSTQEKYPQFLEDQRAFFDELITREWETYQDAGWDTRRRFEIDTLFNMLSARMVLDVGCGCGFHDVLMAEKKGVADVCGIDYSEKSIETANRIYPHPEVRRSVEDIGRATIIGQFDLVISFQVIEHLTDPAGFLKDCARHAAPGGYIVAVTPNRLRLSNRLRILAGGQAQLGDPQHYREYVPSDLIALGREQGLEFFGLFAYGVTLRVPKTNFHLLPLPLGLRLGRLVPSISDCFGVILQKPK